MDVALSLSFKFQGVSRICCAANVTTSRAKPSCDLTARRSAPPWNATARHSSSRPRAGRPPPPHRPPGRTAVVHRGVTAAGPASRPRVRRRRDPATRDAAPGRAQRLTPPCWVRGGAGWDAGARGGRREGIGEGPSERERRRQEAGNGQGAGAFDVTGERRPGRLAMRAEDIAILGQKGVKLPARREG